MSFWSSVGNYFLNFGKSLFGQLSVTISQFIHEFGEQDAGQTAADAVLYAAATLGTGADKVALRDAAKAKLIADLEKDGKDVATLGIGMGNFLIESAFQFLTATAAKIPGGFQQLVDGYLSKHPIPTPATPPVPALSAAPTVEEETGNAQSPAPIA